MRHATDEDLNRLEPLLGALRRTPGLRERRRGSFSRGSRAFLHFHADGGDFYADVRLDDRFERVKVTNPKEHEELLSRVREVLDRSSASQ
ncbi:MAG: hypothetical protein ABSC35_14620 [Candidatus Dormibacteria bacterium]